MRLRHSAAPLVRLTLCVGVCLSLGLATVPSAAAAPPGTTGQHQTGQHQTGQHPTGQHQTGQHQTGQHQTGQHPTGQHQTGQHQTGQHQTGQHQTGQHRTGQGAAYPSKAKVAQARASAQARAQDVSNIKAQLIVANQRLQQAGTVAEEASEAYNGARWRLSQAKAATRAAHRAADRARLTVSTQRDRIGALVAQSYQQAGDLTALNAMMSADGPEGVLDQYAAFQGASTSLQADYKRFAAADSLATVFAAKADSAQARQVALATKAATAQRRAASAAEAAQAETAAIAAEQARLVSALARAQHISVSLARSRQHALDVIARHRAEARARAAAAAAAAAQARADARAKARAEARQRAARAAARKALAEQRKHDRAPSGTGGGATDPAPAPLPPPLPDPTGTGPSGPSRHGVAQAVAFATAQLGKPYQWGAAGPSSWDCSGLTMAAWGSAGISLPHYSVAQYASGTPIPIGSARAGDLYFWSSNGRPSGIHHVALAIGDGQFIEAPHTGADVRYDSVYAWYPSFAVRL